VKLHEASRGRVLLRLGEVTSPRVADEASLNTMVEGIVTVRSMLRNEPTIPVYVGAVSSRALYLAGAHADGVQLGALANPGYIEWAWEQISQGAEDHGRDPASIDLVASVLVRVDRSSERARDRALNLLAFWLQRVDWSVIQHSGADLSRVKAIRRSVERYGIGPALPLITDDVIDAFAAVGDPDTVVRQLDRYVAAGVRGVLAWPIPSVRNGWELLTEQVWPHVRAAAELRSAAAQIS
jgi:5,10-methylenetetrahydromethanopterin reductase